MPSADNESVRHELTSIRQSVGELQAIMLRVADALERLARLEERHANAANSLDRAFTAIDSIDKRLSEIESQQHLQKVVTSWAVGAAWAAIGLIATLALRQLGLI